MNTRGIQPIQVTCIAILMLICYNKLHVTAVVKWYFLYKVKKYGNNRSAFIENGPSVRYNKRTS